MTSVGSLISVIIPCLNEVKAIDETLEPLLSLGADLEIIVVDGGSSDGTVDRVRAYPGIRLLSTRKGRGHQLDFGARAANGAMLWFLHADTLITPEAMRELRQAIADPVILSGNFTLIWIFIAACAAWASSCACPPRSPPPRAALKISS
jgi:glycosyltransferase involved in cell wall biosynthesis